MTELADFVLFSVFWLEDVDKRTDFIGVENYTIDVFVGRCCFIYVDQVVLLWFPAFKLEALWEDSINADICDFDLENISVIS